MIMFYSPPHFRVGRSFNCGLATYVGSQVNVYNNLEHFGSIQLLFNHMQYKYDAYGKSVGKHFLSSRSHGFGFEIIEDPNKLGNMELPSNEKLPYKGEYIKIPVELPLNSTRFCRCPNTHRIIEIPHNDWIFAAGMAMGYTREQILKFSPQLLQVITSQRMFHYLNLFYRDFPSTRDRTCYAEFEQIVSSNNKINLWFLDLKRKQSIETDFPSYLSEVGYSLSELEEFRVAYNLVRQEQHRIALKSEELALKYRVEQRENELDYEKFLKNVSVSKNKTVDMSNNIDFRIMLLKVSDLPLDLTLEAHHYVYPTFTEIIEARKSLKEEIKLDRDPTDEELFRVKGICVNKKFKLRQILAKYQLFLVRNKHKYRIEKGEIVVIPPSGSSTDASLNNGQDNNQDSDSRKA